MSKKTVNGLAAVLLAAGVVGYLVQPHVVWVLVGFAGAALKINDWIKGDGR